MNSKKIFGLVSITIFLISVSLSAAGAVSEPIAEGKFRSPLLKRDLGFRVFAPAQASEKAMPMVVYVKGLGIERLGTVSDSELIDGFLKKGILVAEVDYEKDGKAQGADMYIDVMYMYRIFGGDPAKKPGSKAKKAPSLRDEFIKWDPNRTETYVKFTVQRDSKEIEYKINPFWVYVIPAGYTIDRDIEVSTISTDKRTTVHRMDVIHPASSDKGVPAVLQVTAVRPLADKYFSRLNKGKTIEEIESDLEPEDPAKFTRIGQGACYVYAWTMAGYAGVIMDNVANHATSMWLYNKQMTCPTGPHFPEKRALRLLRARKSEFSLNGKVAVTGNSKSNMRAIMSGLVNNERPNEKYVREADKGPYADQSDRFDVMLTGGFPKRPIEHRMILDYLSDDDPALIWCQTIYLSRMRRPDYVQELLDKQAVLRQIEKRCEAFGVPYKDYFGTPIGHSFDYVYLQDIMAFADKYMK